MIDRATDPGYLRYQYGNSERLRIRYEAHTRYSERPSNWFDLFAQVLEVTEGTTIIDVGCGFGGIHPTLSRAGARVTGIDQSPGMVQEARQQAERESLTVTVMEGDAQQLPLPDDHFSAALSSHMLYHVPDIARALSEMRRVVRPGGKVLITTNAADHSRRLNELHEQAAREHGFNPVGNSPERRFSLDHLPLVQSVFPNVELQHLPNAFIFPTVESAIRYYASGRVDAVERTGDETGYREPLIRRMEELIGEIIAREGVFRVPKNAGYFLATVS